MAAVEGFPAFATPSKYWKIWWRNIQGDRFGRLNLPRLYHGNTLFRDGRWRPARRALSSQVPGPMVLWLERVAQTQKCEIHNGLLLAVVSPTPAHGSGASTD